MPFTPYLSGSSVLSMPSDSVLRTWLPTHGKDVLAVWPDAYNCEIENERWSTCLPWEQMGRGYNRCVTQTSFEQYTVNYAFAALFDEIPSNGTNTGVVVYSVNSAAGYERKMRNMWAMLRYIKSYPTDDEINDGALGPHVSHGTFWNQVVPTIYSVAAKINLLDWNLRLWNYNHTEVYTEGVLTATDCWPHTVCCPENRFLQRILKSGKYTEFVVKGEYTIALAPGFPVDYCGPHIAIRHDGRLFNEETARRRNYYISEFGLGDKA